MSSVSRYVIHHVSFFHRTTARELHLEQSPATVIHNPTCANNPVASEFVHPWTGPACPKAGQACKAAQGPCTYTHWRFNEGNNTCLRRLGHSDKRKWCKTQGKTAHHSTGSDHQEIEDLEGCEGVFKGFPRYSSLHKLYTKLCCFSVQMSIFSLGK